MADTTELRPADQPELHRSSDRQWQSPHTPKREAGQGDADSTSADTSFDATVTGRVEYRAGDGPTMCVPEGPVHVDLTETDATLGWDADDARQSAAIPMAEFRRYVDERAITLPH